MGNAIPGRVEKEFELMRIFWFLCGNERVPSSRIHGINIHDKLRERGYASQVVFKPYKYVNDLYFDPLSIAVIAACVKKEDVVVIQKLAGPETVKFMKRLKDKGVRVVFIDCDLPLKADAAALADLVVCPAEELKRKYEHAGEYRVLHIDDAVESSKPPVTGSVHKRRMVWFGKSGLGKWEAVQWLKTEIMPLVNDKWELVTVSDHPEATIQWQLDTVVDAINQSDLAVIPVPEGEYDAVKSANRCTQSLALGVPVLCHYLPGYRDAIKDYSNGLVSNHIEEWITFIRTLEDDATLRIMKENAFQSSKVFSMDMIINSWISALGLTKSNVPEHKLIKLITIAFAYYYRVRVWIYHAKRRFRQVG